MLHDHITRVCLGLTSTNRVESEGNGDVHASAGGVDRLYQAKLLARLVTRQLPRAVSYGNVFELLIQLALVARSVARS